MLDFSNAMLSQDVVCDCPQGRFLGYLGRVFSKLGLVRNIKSSSKTVLIALNWPSEARLFPITYFNEVIPWITDCWGYDFEKWEKIFSRHDMKHVFMSARDTRDYFTPLFPTIKFHWLPEAVDLTRFHPGLPLFARTEKLFEMGRSWPKYHEVCLDAMDGTNGHVYGRFLDPLCELPAFLSDNSILICFPKKTTHPEQSGNVETATQRYFEGMASGCLLVGHAPDELIDLFGYNPTLEVDWSRPVKQLREIVRSLDNYQSLVDRNLRRLKEVGTFDTRIQSMLEILRLNGYTT